MLKILKGLTPGRTTSILDRVLVAVPDRTSTDPTSMTFTPGYFTSTRPRAISGADISIAPVCNVLGAPIFSFTPCSGCITQANAISALRKQLANTQQSNLVLFTLTGILLVVCGILAAVVFHK